MPLQRFNPQPVPRPSGLVPPAAHLTGVTELRLHGVGGTTPHDLLGDDAPQQVSGDRIAGFYRTADLHDRHVEAYSWGGMTSRSGSRVLWLLLFPFALANVAGWMCTPRTHRSAWRFRLHRTAVRWAALGVTLNLLLIAAITTMDLVGYQCGAQQGCADNSLLLRPLRDPLLADHPGRRVLAGALVPFALVVLLAVLALRSISRYEAVEPPSRIGAAPPADDAYGAAQPGLGLPDPHFWDGRRSAATLGLLHIGAGLGFVAVTLAYTVHTTSLRAGVPVTAQWLRAAALVLGGLVILGALALTGPASGYARVAGWLLALGSVAVVCAACFAAVQPAFPQPFGYLPGLRDTARVAITGVFGALLLVLLAALLGGRQKGTFVIFAPFVVLTLSVLALNVVLLGTMNRVADLLARVSTRPNLPNAPSTRPELYVYPIIGKVLPYLTLLPLALLVLFAVYELVTYWRAGTDERTLARIRAWYRDNDPRPAGEEHWQCSALEDGPAEPSRARKLWALLLGRRWEAHIARARRVARMPNDIDKLLTAMAALGLGLLIAIQIRYVVFHELPWGTPWMFTLASYLAAGIPIALILLLRRGWRDLNSRRRIGVIWDVITFWPRAYHPLAPPSYAERAVPELQRRLWRIHDSGGRVVLTAHSQGTVLAAAALLQPHNRPADDEVALVTFGSPLRTLYGWAFPAYFDDELLGRLVPPGGEARVSVWRNFYHPTDYIGGAVLPERPKTGVDVERPDPATSWYIYGQPKPVVARHSGYWTDAAVWRSVDQFAAAIRPPGPGSG